MKHAGPYFVTFYIITVLMVLYFFVILHNLL